MIDDKTARRLRGLHEADSHCRAILDHFSNRAKNSEESTVDALVGALKQEGVAIEYWEVREALKKLAAATDSRFIRGRRGGKTRVHWNGSIVEMGNSGRGSKSGGNGNTPIVSSSKTDRVFHHRFPLRDDFIIEADFPLDMDVEEANRYVQSVLALARKRDKEAA